MVGVNADEGERFNRAPRRLGRPTSPAAPTVNSIYRTPYPAAPPGIVVLDPQGATIYDSLTASRDLLNDQSAADVLRSIMGIAISPDQKWLAAMLRQRRRRDFARRERHPRCGRRDGRQHGDGFAAGARRRLRCGRKLALHHRGRSELPRHRSRGNDLRHDQLERPVVQLQRLRRAGTVDAGAAWFRLASERLGSCAGGVGR